MALGQSFVWGDGGAQMTPEQIAAQRKVADALMQQGMDYSPIASPWQGLARVSQALMGGYEGYRADQAEKANRDADQKLLASLLPQSAAVSTTPAAPSAPPISPASAPTVTASAAPTGGDPAAAISSIESGGKYDLLGPVTRTGDRAYGKYQVMGSNVGPWTTQYTGQQLTPEQFIASPQAQDAVFKGEFGRLSQKYGPEGAARAWFAGEGGMNDMSRKDMLGTTVAAYADKFNRGMGTTPQPAPTTLVGNNPSYAPAPAAPVQAVTAAMQPDAPRSGPLAGIDPKLLSVVASPYASEGVKKIAGLLIAAQTKDTNPTNDIKEYQMAKSQGFTGSLLDYQTKLKEAGKPVTNINQQQESEYQKATGKHFADLNNNIATGALKARGEVATLSKLGSLLSDPNIYTGKGGDMVLEAKRLAKAAGFDVGDLGGAEAVRAIQNQFALELRNPSGGAGMPGAMSDSDRAFLSSLPPGLEKTREGNQQISEYRKKVAERAIDVDRLRQNYVKQNGRLDEGFYRELADYSEKNPLFANETQAAPAKIRRFNPATGKIE